METRSIQGQILIETVGAILIVSAILILLLDTFDSELMSFPNEKYEWIKAAKEGYE